MGGSVCRASSPPSLLQFIHLLHLNQTGVQHLISNLTNAHASSLRHSDKGALDVRAGLIDTYMDTQIPSQYSCAENVG